MRSRGFSADIRATGLKHRRDADVAAVLTRQGITEPKRVETLVRLAGGSPGQALALNDETVWDFYSGFVEAVGRAKPAATDVAHVAPRLDHHRVADCLERLPERERAVLVMTFYDERPLEAVGLELGLSAGNVRVIRHRGIDKLRRCVDAGRTRLAA